MFYLICQFVFEHYQNIKKTSSFTNLDKIFSGYIYDN